MLNSVYYFYECSIYYKMFPNHKYSQATGGWNIVLQVSLGIRDLGFTSVVKIVKLNSVALLGATSRSLD